MPFLMSHLGQSSGLETVCSIGFRRKTSKFMGNSYRSANAGEQTGNICSAMTNVERSDAQAPERTSIATSMSSSAKSTGCFDIEI